MSTKLTEQILVRMDPGLKSALENLLYMSDRQEYPTLSSLIRDILSVGVKNRLSRKVNKTTDEAQTETDAEHEQD